MGIARNSSEVVPVFQNNPISSPKSFSRGCYISIFIGMTETVLQAAFTTFTCTKNWEKPCFKESHVGKSTFPQLSLIYLLFSYFLFHFVFLVHTCILGIQVPMYPWVWWQTGVSTKVQSIIKNLSWILRLST